MSGSWVSNNAIWAQTELTLDWRNLFLFCLCSSYLYFLVVAWNLCWLSTFILGVSYMLKYDQKVNKTRVRNKEWHGDGDGGNTAVTAVITAVMGTTTTSSVDRFWLKTYTCVTYIHGPISSAARVKSTYCI